MKKTSDRGCLKSWGTEEPTHLCCVKVLDHSIFLKHSWACGSLGLGLITPQSKYKFLCFTSIFTVFEASKCNVKMRKTNSVCKMMQNQIFLIRQLACFHLLLLNIKSDKLQRSTSIWPSQFLHTCWVLMSSFGRGVNMLAFAETANVIFRRGKGLFFKQFSDLYFWLCFHPCPVKDDFSWLPWEPAEMNPWDSSTHDSWEMLITSQAWSISDRRWQVWPPSYMWVCLQAPLESYEWPLQTHAW